MKFLRLRSGSGVPIWFYPMPYIQSVTMGMIVRAGTRDEDEGESGIAHALEHMLCQGTDEFPDSQVMTSEIESVGGDFNAFTSPEMTFYYSHLPAYEAERGFRVLSQMLRKPTIPETKITSEMQNIVQEIRQANDDPQSFAYKSFYETIYGAHPLRKRVLGSEESVLNFTREHFYSFMRRFYHPANYAFLVVGNIELDRISEIFDQYFPESIGQPPLSRMFFPSTLPKLKELKISRKDIEQANIFLGTTTTYASHRLMPALTMFRIMIDGGNSFPLFQEIRNKRGLCYAIGSDNEKCSDLGYFYIYIGTDPARKEEAIEASLNIIGQCRDSSELLERAKRLALGGLATYQNESPHSITIRATKEIGREGEPKNYDELVSMVKSVGIDEVEEAVNEFLSPPKIVKVMLVPDDTA